MMKVKDSYNVDAAAIAAATAAVKDQDYFSSNIEKIKSERCRLSDSLGRLGFEVRASEANFVLAKYVAGDAADIQRQLADRNIYVRYFNLPGLADKLRITVGTGEQNDKLIDALKQILRQ
jgi:histidinol-phosphate aminotransferase